MKLPIGQIICADCLDFTKDLPDKSIDLILTDPPYGIDYNNDKLQRYSNATYADIENDKGELNYKVLIIELMRIGKRVIIFGAINFFKDLPYKGIWICWDKRTRIEADMVLGSPFELAWCDKIGGYDKIYRVMHGGVINDDSPNKHGTRFHPTQKPIRLMAAIIRDFSKPGDIILDPFVGSGTTCVAAEKEGRRWIGIEIDKDYCKIAKERIEYTKRNKGFQIR